MVKIKLDNSYSKIEGLKAEEFRGLKKLLSYQVNPNAAFYQGGFVRTKSLLDAKGNFPTGLLSHIETYLKTENIKFQQIDIRKKPKSKILEFPSLPITPYPEQLKAVDMAITKKRCGIVAATGFGKSLVIALIASRLNVKTLVVVPSVGIREQLIEAFKAYKINMSQIEIYNIDSKALKTKTDFECLIIDECHHVAAKTYQDLNKKAWTGIYYRFFLTATWGRNQEHEKLLFQGIAGDVAFRIDFKEAAKKGFVVPVEGYYFTVPKTQYAGYKWAEIYNELVVKNEIRNNLIGALMLRLQVDRLATLCLVKEIEHGEILSKLTGIPFANGQDQASRVYIEDFNKGLISSLIGTTGILGEGVDTKPAEYIIIAGLGKAKSAFMQCVGRGVRKFRNKESCKIILFQDKSHKWCIRHFNEQKKILSEEYGTMPLKLEI